MISTFKKVFYGFGAILLCFQWQGFSDSLEEKLAFTHSDDDAQQTDMDSEVALINTTIKSLKEQLAAKHLLAKQLVTSNANEEDFLKLIEEINETKHALATKEIEFKKYSIEQSKLDEEGYGLWDQEETTLSQLVLEYGSSDFLYIVPPELAKHKLTLHSSIPVPRESWDELLTIVLAHNGIGVKEINPFAKQLYSLKQDLTSAATVTSNRQYLATLPDLSRVIYVFSPHPEHFKTAYHFLERFRDPKRMFVYTVGSKIVMVATKEETLKLLQLYESVWESAGEKVTRVVPCTKMNTKEMEKILKTFFGSTHDPNKFSMTRGMNEIAILPLSNENSLVLVGNRDLVLKATQIVEETESQFEVPCEMTLYSYTCKHSDPNDIAEVLQRVYTSLVCYKINGSGNDKVESQQNVNIEVTNPDIPPPPYIEDPISNAPNPVEPPNALPANSDQRPSGMQQKNFIAYPKTGAIMMVVRRDTLDSLKGLLRKLDVPKKMVHVEVLLCEKKVTQQTNTGLNLLKLGSAADNVRKTGIDYNEHGKGLFQFFISRAKTRKTIPAFDITYNFLLSQDDIRINSSPSLTMVNQTPATISLVEELSVNSGAAPINNNANITFEKAFIRKQYGITLMMTPTIHEPNEEDPNDETLVTLKTNITFDTIKSDVNEQPKVDRRHLENQVRVVDGQTIVIGGLRRKTSDDRTDKIPFLGEVPGIAKLFGTSKMTDETTEMFIFITPRVIHDSVEDVEKLREEELAKRAGDCPEYLCRLIQARQCQKKKLFEQSFKLIFGNIDDN